MYTWAVFAFKDKTLCASEFSVILYSELFTQVQMQGPSLVKVSGFCDILLFAMQ